MTYDYRAAMIADIKRAIGNYNYCGCYNFDDVKSYLYKCLWVDDHVTGNGSEAYIFPDSPSAYALSGYEAADCVNGNDDILADAMEEFDCISKECFKKAFTDPIWCDVTIRCYLLGECIEEVFEDSEIQEAVAEMLADPYRRYRRR